MNSTEIQFLVGLLTQVTQPDTAQVVLGEMVYNVASRTRRDLDVTVKYHDKNGDAHIFSGLEVKAHERSLDSAQIEQLCAKLNTHTKVKSKGIVSTSGYTAPAIAIANYYSVDLYELKDWDLSKFQFEHIVLNPSFTVLEQASDGQTIQHKLAYKILTKLLDPTYLVGCALTEINFSNSISGFTVSNFDRTFRHINIPYISRKLKKIYNIPLLRQSSQQ